jgi:hypothetical protein
MTYKTIEDIIEKLNNKSDKHLIFTKKIGLNVDVARFWKDEPKVEDLITSNGLNSYIFFFIKNDSGEYVAAVLDMDNDLH